MGREDELVWEGTGEASVEEMGVRIASLPAVEYGRSKEMLAALNLQQLTGSSMGIKFVDLGQYSRLNVSGSMPSGEKRGGVLINVYKTAKADPEHVYIAVSEDIDDGTLVHQLAHALTYLSGSKWPAGTLDPLAYEIGIPTDHLEHPEEFGYWLDTLAKKFDVRLDADDAIIRYLYEKSCPDSWPRHPRKQRRRPALQIGSHAQLPERAQRRDRRDDQRSCRLYRKEKSRGLAG